MSAAVPHNIAQGFANGGISLILDDEGIIRCQITPIRGAVSSARRWYLASRWGFG
jgi:hypothetical protein